MEEASHGMDGWMHWMDVLTRDFDAAHAHCIVYPIFTLTTAQKERRRRKKGRSRSDVRKV